MKSKPSPTTDIVQTRTEGYKILTPLQARVEVLAITTPQQYLEADSLLTQIASGKAMWKEKVSPIVDPLKEAVRQAKLALKGVDDLSDSILDPLNILEARVRGAMREYKLEEARLLREAEEKKRAEVLRLEREAAEANRKALEARTAPMRARIAQRQAELAQQRQDIAQEEAAPVAAAGSTTRTQKRARVVDIKAFARAIADEVIPEECILVDLSAVLQHYRASPDIVKEWPGVEVYDDVIIARRSTR